MAIQRGFMKPGGVPDHFKAARIILKDFVTGRLLFPKAPPNMEQEAFHSYDTSSSAKYEQDDDDELALCDTFPGQVAVRAPSSSGMHTRGVHGLQGKGMV